MRLRRNLSLLLLVLVSGCRLLQPPSDLESIRAAGARTRERTPYRGVGGYGTLAEAKALIATGESEEIDYWRLDREPTAAERADLRKAFDGAGGKAVQILGPGEKFVRRPPAQQLKVSGELTQPLLIAGTDRALLVAPDGRVLWEKRGCGNIHTARRLGDFIYYSNGALYRVPVGCDKWATPECVWKPRDSTGGGVLCFDTTINKTIVFGVNSTEEVIELAPLSGRVLRQFRIDNNPAPKKALSPHGRLRNVHRFGNDDYLVSGAESANARRYYAPGSIGSPKAEGYRGGFDQAYPAPNFVFDAVWLEGGSYVLSYVSGVSKYRSDGKLLWTLTPEDVKSIKAANFTSVQALPNGNLVVGTWANGADDASRAGAFEITPDKQIVWSIASSTDVNMMTVLKVDWEK